MFDNPKSRGGNGLSPEARQRRRERRRREIDTTIPSPCIQVCTLDMTHSYCLGCYRSPLEIQTWMIMTREEKEKALVLAERRRAEADEVS